MPRNLLLNYLDEVRKQREYLLNKWQLTSPSHLESVDSYAHNGTLEDYVYRLPWLRVPDKGSTQHLANLENLTADLQRLVNVVNDLEKYSSASKGVVHIVHDDGDVIEVVPSSNPDSPPVDKEQVAEISKQIGKKTPATEDFCSVSELSSLSDKDKDKYLPTLMEANIFQESLSKLPRLEALCERLKPKPVQDPLAGNEIDTIRQELKYVSLGTADDTKQKDVSHTTESFHKMVIPSSQDTRLLEEPDITSRRTPDNHQQTLHHLMAQNEIDLSCEVIDDQDTKEDVHLTDASEEHQGPETYDVPITPRKELHALNNEGIRERKKVTDTLLFETVIEKKDTSSKGTPGGLLQTLKLDKEDFKNFEDGNMILSPSEESQIRANVWNAEKNFLDFPSLRLQEPNMESRQQRKQHAHQTTALEHLHLKDNVFKITLDSSLSWNPVAATRAGMNKMSKKIEVYQTEMMSGNDNVMDASKAVQRALMEDRDKIDLKEFITWDQEDKQLSQDTKNNCSKIQTDVPTAKDASRDEHKESQETLAKPSKETYVKERGKTHQDRESSLSVEMPMTTFKKHKLEQIPPKSQTPTGTSKMPNKLEQLPHKSGIAMSSSKMHNTTEPPPKLVTTTTNQQINNRTTTQTKTSTNKEIPSSSEADTNIFKKEKMKTKMMNPLDDFLMLRTVPLKREAAKTSPKPSAKIIKKVMRTPEVRPSLSQEQDTKPLESQEVTSYESNAAKKSKSKLVEVTLTDPFLDILGVIEMATQPVLNQLRKMGIISASYSSSSLTPDITRFLLKQQEKMQDTNKKAEPKEALKLRCLLQLHALITTADLITHCDLTTAILHLSAVQEKYVTSLEGCLDNIRQTLYQKQCMLHKDKVMHPKLMAIIRQTADWYKRKLSKEGGDHDPKILVIIRREARKLVEVVAETLAKVQGITTSTSQSIPTMYDAVSKQLDSCNCLVLIATQIGQDFPWALFSLVVEYEHMEASPWLELCQRQNIRHMVLKTMPVSTARERKDGVEEMMSKDCVEDTVSQSQGGKPLKLVASEDVILCSQLLQLLESRHDIMLIERNYSKVTGDPASSKLYFADLIVDERTGIILQDLHQLSEPHTIEPLVNRITKLSLQYSICWLILYRQKGKNTGYPLGGQAVNNLAKLQAAVAQFSVKTDGYEAKVLFADNLVEVAQLIHQIADNSAKALVNWHQTDWLTRPWLTNTVSKHEKVLLQFPCLNSFSAQVMLTAAPLRKLLTMSLQELIITCPWIQHKNLQMFHSLAHGLQEILPQLTKQQPTKPPPGNDTSSTQLPHTLPTTVEPQVPGNMADYSNASSKRFAAEGPADPKMQRYIAGDIDQQYLHGATSGQALTKTQSRSGIEGGSSSEGIRGGGVNISDGQDLAPHDYRSGQRFPITVKQECDEYGQQVARQGSSGSIGFTHYTTHHHQDLKPFQDISPLEFITRNCIKQEPGVASQSYHTGQRFQQTDQHKVSKGQQYCPDTDHSSRGHPYGVSDQQHQYPAHQSSFRQFFQMEESSRSFQDNPKSYHCIPEQVSSYRYHPLQQSAYMTREPRSIIRSMDPSSVSQESQQSAYMARDPRSAIRPMDPSVNQESQQTAYLARDPRSTTRPIDRPAFHPESQSQLPMSSDMHLPRHPHQPQRQSSVDIAKDSVPYRVNTHQGDESNQRQAHMMESYQRNIESTVPTISRHYDRWTPRDHRTESGQAQRRHPPQDAWYTPMHSGRVQYQADQSVPSSAEVDREDAYLADGYDEGDLGFDAVMENQQVPLTPSKKRRITYERVPGAKGGQTRLSFY